MPRTLHFTERSVEILKSLEVCFIVCVQEPDETEWAIVHCRDSTGHVEYRTTILVAEEVAAQLRRQSDVRSFHSGFDVNLAKVTKVIVNFWMMRSHKRLGNTHALGFDYGMYVRLSHEEFQNSGGLKTF